MKINFYRWAEMSGDERAALCRRAEARLEEVLPAVQRIIAAVRAQGESMRAQDLVGSRHPIARELGGNERCGGERARRVELEGAKEVLELAVGLAGVTTALRGADVGLGTRAR